MPGTRRSTFFSVLQLHAPRLARAARDEAWVGGVPPSTVHPDRAHPAGARRGCDPGARHGRVAILPHPAARAVAVGPPERTPPPPPPPPPEEHFILHRFNGDEVYRFESAVRSAYETEHGVTLWFEVKADPEDARRCEDTAEMGMAPDAEVGIDLPDLDADELVGREFVIPGTQSDDEDSCMSLLYYCEHEALRRNQPHPGRVAGWGSVPAGVDGHRPGRELLPGG